MTWPILLFETRLFFYWVFLWRVIRQYALPFVFVEALVIFLLFFLFNVFVIFLLSSGINRLRLIWLWEVNRLFTIWWGVAFIRILYLYEIIYTLILIIVIFNFIRIVWVVLLLVSIKSLDYFHKHIFKWAVCNGDIWETKLLFYLVHCLK